MCTILLSRYKIEYTMSYGEIGHDANFLFQIRDLRQWHSGKKDICCQVTRRDKEYQLATDTLPLVVISITTSG